MGKSLAIGYVARDAGEVGTALELEVLGQRYPAKVIPDSPADPENEKLRA